MSVIVPNITSEHVTGDELVAIALQRLDRVALRIASSTALQRAELERHADLADLSAVYIALATHQRLYAAGEVTS